MKIVLTNSPSIRQDIAYPLWKSRNAHARWKEDISAEMKQPPFAFPESPWVAVLFDGGTGSSGEAVAISVAGRPRARSFGEHTAGFSTANEMYPLPDGASLFVCDGVEADRTGKLYPDGLEPETKVSAADGRPAEENDNILLAAKQWLAKQTETTAQKH